MSRKTALRSHGVCPIHLYSIPDT